MGFQFDRRPKDLEKLRAAGSLVGTLAWGLTPPHPRGTGLGWGPRVRVALAHFPGETTKVLLFVPFFFFFVPKSYPGFVCKARKGGHNHAGNNGPSPFQEFQKYTASNFPPVIYDYCGNCGRLNPKRKMKLS